MTATQVAKRITFWQKKLGLEAWKIRLEVVNPNDDEFEETHCAHVKCAGTYLRAIIVFNGVYLQEGDTRDIEQTIVHELMHCLFRDLEVASTGIAESLSPQSEELFMERWKHEYEQLVDRLADSVVEMNAK